MSTSTTSLIRYDDEIKRRLEKLSRTYDLTTMKIFIAVECLGTIPSIFSLLINISRFLASLQRSSFITPLRRCFSVASNLSSKIT